MFSFYIAYVVLSHTICLLYQINYLTKNVHFEYRFYLFFLTVSQRGKKMQEGKLLSEEALQIAEKEEKWKAK